MSNILVTALKAASIIEDRHGALSVAQVDELQRELVSLIARYVERVQLSVLKELQDEAAENLREEHTLIKIRPPKPRTTKH